LKKKTAIEGRSLPEVHANRLPSYAGNFESIFGEYISARRQVRNWNVTGPTQSCRLCFIVCAGAKFKWQV
jgi:hypothetical protein